MWKSVPNILTVSRIVVIPLLVAVFYLEGDYKYTLAMLLFLYAGLTDFLDGYLARKWQVSTALGRFLDPIADKLIVVAAIVMLVYDGKVWNEWDVLPALVIICREILISGLREFLATSNVSVPVTYLAKWKTGVQLWAVGCSLWAPSAPAFLLCHGQGRLALWLAGILTILTGYGYLKAGLRHMLKAG